MKFKAFLQSKGITIEDFAKKEASEQAKLHTEFLDTLESGVSKDHLDAQLKGLVSAETFATLKSQVEQEILEIKGNATKGANQEVTLAKAIEDKKAEIKAIVEGGKGEVEIKANTVRASIANNTQGYRLPDIGQLGTIRPTLYDVLPKTPISNKANDNGVIKYIDWDEATTVRAAATIAEGAAFPEDTATFQEYTLPIRKIGSILPVSEEFGEDSELAAAELENFMQTSLRQEVGDQVVNGNNSGQNLKGLLASVPAYTAPELAIPEANIKDLVRKMRTAIVKTRGAKYAPDIVVANADTIDTYILAKATDGQYLFIEDGRLAGLAIVEDNNMPDNQLVVGDRRFARIYEKGGVVVSEGYTGTQFNTDFKTLKIRKRMAMLIRTVDATGFLKSTDVTADIATLGTTPTP